MGYRVAVVGATGNVGRELVSVLAERAFPVDELIALASEQSVGREISFGEDDVLKVQSLAKFDFKGIDIVLSSPGGAVSADLSKIKRVVVSTYQSTSGAGKAGMDELFNQTRGVYMNQASVMTRDKFTKQIAFNVIPHIDDFMDDGSTKEEWKMSAETRKILDPDIKLVATCVRVPTFVGHGEAVTIEFAKPISASEARTALKKAPGISVVDHRADEGYVTPIECAGDDAVFVSRIRKDPTVKYGLSLWVCSDNLRKGAALNTVQIAEVLIKSYMSKAA
jgi:aspartate-semialdehyde dehydrogenase